jgi:hypothetical protein
MRIITKPGRNTANAQATVAQVSYSGIGDFGALGEAESRGIPVFAPRGISYRPREGDRLLLLRADGADVCAGCLATDALEPGELALASSGGARIHLKNNGEISLNGLVISPDGRIV